MKKLIQVEKLCYTIPFGQKILEGIDFELHEGQFLGILGRNGVGKTTLLDLLLGFRPRTTGNIQVLGEDPLSLERKNLSSICFLSQDIILKGSLSIAEYLKFYSAFYPNYSKQEEQKLLKSFSLSPEVKIGSLSTGQQKKVQIISSLSTLPKILMIDEISAVLDPETRHQFFEALNRHRLEHGLGILLATNIAEDLISRADDVLFIDHTKGTIRKPSEILNLFHIEKAS
jgi:ABC-2 type transport system ATP-binding protein